MTEPKIPFAKLRQLLLDLGFRETVVPKSHVAFEHEKSSAEIILPIYRPSQIVLPHHLDTVRIMLDGKGVMNSEEFKELVALASTKRSAS